MKIFQDKKRTRKNEYSKIFFFGNEYGTFISV
jgi:hypothetical protein